MFFAGPVFTCIDCCVPNLEREHSTFYVWCGLQCTSLLSSLEKCFMINIGNYLKPLSNVYANQSSLDRSETVYQILGQV